MGGIPPRLIRLGREGPLRKRQAARPERARLRQQPADELQRRELVRQQRQAPAACVQRLMQAHLLLSTGHAAGPFSMTPSCSPQLSCMICSHASFSPAPCYPLQRDGMPGRLQWPAQTAAAGHAQRAATRARLRGRWVRHARQVEGCRAWAAAHGSDGTM